MLIFAVLLGGAGWGLIHAANVIYPYDTPDLSSRPSERRISGPLYAGGFALVGAGAWMLIGALRPPGRG